MPDRGGSDGLVGKHQARTPAGRVMLFIQQGLFAICLTKRPSMSAAASGSSRFHEAQLKVSFWLR